MVPSPARPCYRGSNTVHNDAAHMQNFLMLLCSSQLSSPSSLAMSASVSSCMASMSIRPLISLHMYNVHGAQSFSVWR